MFHLDVELEHPIIPKSLPIWRLEIKNTSSIWLLLTLFELLWKKGGETWDSYNWQELFRFGDLFWRCLLLSCRDQCVDKQKWLIGVWRRICVFPFQNDVDEMLVTEQHKSWHEWLFWAELYFNITFFFFFAYPRETPFLKLCMSENYLFLIWFA